MLFYITLSEVFILLILTYMYIYYFSFTMIVYRVSLDLSNEFYELKTRLYNK